LRLTPQTNNNHIAYRIPEPMNLQSISSQHAAPEQNSFTITNPKITIQMPNMHSVAEPQAVQIESMQNFLKQPHQMR
jgi:hypothetical protein